MGGSPLAITFPLFASERSLPLPIFPYGLFCSVYLRIYRFKSASSISPSLFTFAPHWRHPWFSHPLEFHAFLRPPIPLLTLQRFPPLHWDLNTRLDSRNGISNNIWNNVLNEYIKKVSHCYSPSRPPYVWSKRRMKFYLTGGSLVSARKA